MAQEQEQFLKDLKKSHGCGDLRASDHGAEVVLMGWVDTRRDHGGLIFIDLRDRSGLVQVVIDPAKMTNAPSKSFRHEYVVAIHGAVRTRPKGMENKHMPTGEIEVESLRCEVLSEAKTLPFQVDDEKVSENLRLKYRYLDLRSRLLQSHLQKRHDLVLSARNHLSQKGFIEVETPILYKSTPEGARDYLVPSRVTPGSFYALPQSPQTLKQLLMISGVERYFQIAKCFRDEDLRADRQPEFTQIDLEMSFVDQDDLMAVAEEVTSSIWKETGGSDVKEIPRLTYQEAMNRYGCDKPDLRISWELKDLTEGLKSSSFRVFSDVAARGGAIKALFVPGTDAFTRGQFDKLTDLVKQYGAKGLVYIKIDSSEKITSPVSKFLGEDELKKLYADGGGNAPGGTVFVIADDFSIACAGLSALRLRLAEELKAIDESKDRFLWVTEFPLLQYSPEEKRWAACHHPFTAPMDEDLPVLLSGDEKSFSRLRAKAYDFVCNGNEIAGGSIRIHRQEVQRAMFKALGMGEEETAQKFGFFLEALSYGTPPHGGIAWGLDRMVMILCKTDAIRDVIAFPKTAKASCLMSEAPSSVSREQLLELGIKIQSLQTSTSK